PASVHLLTPSLHDALPISVPSGRRQYVAVVLHAGFGVLDARPAIRPVVFRDPSADRVLIVEPHRQDAGPGDRVAGAAAETALARSEEHTSELQSPDHLVCR